MASNNTAEKRRPTPSWKVSYIRHAAHLRKALTKKALSRRLGLPLYTVNYYSRTEAQS